LGGSDFTGASAKGCNFSGSSLPKSVWNDCSIDSCNFQGLTASNVSAQSARFLNCDFRNSILDGLNADGSAFTNSSFSQCKLIASTFTNSKLYSCKLDYALLCKANFDGATLDGCSVFGISIWGSDFSKSDQKNFIVNLPGGNLIVTNSIEYSYFLYQCIENSNFKKYFESTSEKLVLILGRFTPKRMVYIDAIRNSLSKKGLIPVLFDFDKPETQDLSEVVLSLALISRFTVVDLSDPKCAPHEIATIAPHVNSPIAAVIEKGQRPYAMYSDMMRRYSWVLEPEVYQSHSEIESVILNSLLPNCESYIASR